MPTKTELDEAAHQLLFHCRGRLDLDPQQWRKLFDVVRSNGKFYYWYLTISTSDYVRRHGSPNDGSEGCAKKTGAAPRSAPS